MIRLLNLLLDELVNNQLNPKRFEGICANINWLYYLERINKDERQILKQYIYNNKPQNVETKKYYHNTGYFWKIFNYNPRINFIKRLIKNETKSKNIN